MTSFQVASFHRGAARRARQLIARLRPLALAAFLAAGVSACDEEPTAVDAGPSLASAPIAAMELDHDTLRVGIGDTAIVNCRPVDVEGSALRRNCNWRSRDASVATVSGSGTRIGTVVGASVGATWVVANAEKFRDSVRVLVGDGTPTPPDTPPASGDTALVVAPESAALAVGATQQFAALGKTSEGASVPLTVTWSATGGTIDASGLYKAGSITGSYRIIAKAGTLADTSTLTISAPPPSGALAQCFADGEETVRLTGDKGTGTYVNTSLPSGTKINAAGATWHSVKTSGATIRLAGSSSICWRGGRVIGEYDESVTSWETYHNISDFSIWGPNMTVEDFRSENMGDCLATNDQGQNWTARRIHCVRMHDDCFESDWGRSGRLSDVLFEGCYVFIATRPRSSSPVDASMNTIYVDSAIVWHREIPQGYGGVSPSVGPLFKFDRNTPSRSPKVVISNTIIRVDRQANFQGVNLNEQGLVTCARNCTVVWGQAGPYPYPLPPGWTLTRDTSVYTNAVAAWKARHPNL